MVFARHREDAEDLYADTRYRAWRYFAAFDRRCPFPNWVIRIMVRTWINTLAKKRPALSLDAAAEDEEGAAFEVDTHDPRAEQEFSRTIDVLIIEHHLEDMNPVLAQDLVLRTAYGYTMREIGQAWDITADAIWTRIRRERRKAEVFCEAA